MRWTVRIVFRHELHDAAIRQINHPVQQHRQRNVAADRDVVLERQGQYGVRLAAGAQSGALLLVPSLTWAGIAGIHMQRQKFQIASNRALYGKIERAVIAVETDDIARAGAQRRLAVEAGVAAEIPDRLRPRTPDKIRHEGLLALLLFRQIGILGLIAAPDRGLRRKRIAQARDPGSEIAQHELQGIQRQLAFASPQRPSRDPIGRTAAATPGSAPRTTPATTICVSDAAHAPDLRGNSFNRAPIPGIEWNLQQRRQQQRIEKLFAELPLAEPHLALGV